MRMNRKQRQVLSPEKYRALGRRKVVEQKFRCAGCGKRLQLEQHHIRARGAGGGWREDTMGNIDAVCGNCHRAEGYAVSKTTGERNA